MRIAIVDDLAAERALLQSRLERQFSRRNVQAAFYGFESGEAFLAAEKAQHFTAAFLDIYMNGMSGMEAARELRKLDTDCMLVFTTTSTDHALEGFQVRAMHYLVKPYGDEEISRLMAEIRMRLPKADRSLTLKVNGAQVKLCCRDIVFAEHFSHNIHIHTAGRQELVTRLAFGEFMEQMQGDTRFFQCSRGIAVNFGHALDFDGKTFRMDDGSSIGVSRDLSKPARQAFMDYLFQRGNAQ